MSYILDALRRADAERERGAVPSIHAQQYALMPGEDDAGAGSRLAPWIIGALAVALLGALAWIFIGRAAPPPVAAVRTPPSAVSVAPSIVAAAPAPPSLPPSSPAVAGPSATPAAATAIAPTASGKALRRPIRKAAPSASAPASPAPASKTPAVAPGANGDKRIYAQRDLPDTVRKELPNVTVSGSTYSSNRASRMLMIGGQLFHEGDSVAKGLMLQQIRPHSAVFDYKGYRYEVVF